MPPDKPTQEKPPQDKPAQEKPEDTKQSSARDQRVFVAWTVTQPETGTAAASDIEMAAMAELTKRAETEPTVSTDRWIAQIAQPGSPCQAIVLFLAVGCCSSRKMARDIRDARSWESFPRRRSEPSRRRHNPHRESRRTRGPPASGPPGADLEIKKGRQQCLPFFVLGRTGFLARLPRLDGLGSPSYDVFSPLATRHYSISEVSPSARWRRAKAAMASACSSVSMDPGRSRRTRAMAFLADMSCPMK